MITLRVECFHQVFGMAIEKIPIVRSWALSRETRKPLTLKTAQTYRDPFI